jgi:hypothetical protein
MFAGLAVCSDALDFSNDALTKTIILKVQQLPVTAYDGPTDPAIFSAGLIFQAHQSSYDSTALRYDFVAPPPQLRPE